MAFDSATVFTAQAPPTPTDTPRQTPSRGSSRHARRRRSSSPPSIPRDEGSLHGEQEATKDEGNGEDISPLDPRRFTPNLHASLVSQILTLQHEVENRNKTVNNLEESLDIAKTENEKLNNSLKDQAKEYRSMRKQMQLLESTTLTALENIAKERDDATENLADTRKTLETSKSRIRNQEEEVTRAQSLWDTERQKWNIERHNMETKVELVEGRLKTVLAEIAAVEVNGHEYPRTSVELDEGVHGTWYTKRSDSISSRSNSGNGQTRFSGLSNATNEVSEYLNFRASTLSGLNGFGGNRPNGMSLADELDFREDEDDCEGEGAGGMTSPDALLGEAQFNRRRPSVQSTSQDHKAWKRLGLLPENVEQTIEEERLTEKRAAAHGNNHNLTEKPSIEGEKVIYPKKATAVQYIDSATQISPPASPNIRPQSDVSEKVTERTSIMEHTANQSRKRVSSLMIEQMTPLKPVTQLVSPMASAGCQTIDQSPSPPLTPIIAIEPVASASVHADKVVEMISSSMQTDEQEQTVLASVSTRQKPSSVMIPVIEIHPPGSRPPSFHNSVVLPPRTKNAGCQASIELPVSSRSISVQTDVVISGKLPVDLPPKSMPKTASQSSLPQIGLEKIDERSQQPPQQPPRTSSRKNLERKLPIGSSRPQIKPSFSAPAIDTYPVNNDSGPLTSRQPASLRRPVRSGSLFAGFDSTFTDGSLKLKDFDLSSDDDFATVPPIRKTLSKVQNSWKLIPRSKNEFLGRLKSAKNSMDNLDIGESPDPWLASLVPLGEHEQATAKASGDDAGRKDLRSSEDIKQSSTRQAASRATARGPSVQRRQSPSAPNLPKKDFGTVAPPPFPVPTRSSSRRIPISASEGARSPTPDTTTFFSTARKSEAGRSPSQNPLRKVRSAAAVPRERSNGQARTPPQPISPSMLASDSPQLPRMLSSDVTSRNPKATQHVQHTTHALPPASLSGEALTDTPGQSTSVVDAIAQTMVGEWMWKYVRRRKSFGITDDVDFDANGNGKGDGIRHKRWVWLAPYERAVIWSSKQPTSGPALMGKHGRKLNIQSVLDVKDDAPISKNSDPQTCFGRSILILTPQRALKFTATTRDRHYVWLTALSFLSHSPLGVDDLSAVPPMTQAEYQRPPSRSVSGGLRRTPIRKSLRIGKSKERPVMGGHAYSSPITTLHHEAIEGIGMPILADDPDSDAAEPPAIPRTVAHTRTHPRKRSSTGPRPAPPSSSHSFPAGAAMASTRSLKTPTTDDYSDFPPRGFDASAPTSAHASMSHGSSQHAHDPMPSFGPVRNNFFDAVGTVRMEAFVDQKDMRGEKAPRKQPSLGNHWAKKTGKKDLRYWGVGGERTAGGGGPGKGVDDPFSRC